MQRAKSRTQLPEPGIAGKHWCMRRSAAERLMMQDRERDKTDEKPGSSQGEQESTRHPYEASELEKLPRPTDDDPPYRSWWVI